MATYVSTYSKTFYVISLFSCPLPVQAATFAGGTGEPNNAYQIATAEQLISIGSDPNLLDKHFILLNDIDLDPNLPGGRVFTRAVIAPSNENSMGAPFTGCFDGQGHVIRNMTVRNDKSGLLGLFGWVGLDGRVQNLGLENVVVQGKDYVGGLTGENDSVVSNCHVSGRITGSMMVGGIAGRNCGTVSDCRAATTVTGGAYNLELGGVVGQNEGRVVGCQATGAVIGSYTVGGLVGLNLGGAIVNCSAAGQVSGGDGSSSLGGLIGYAGSSTHLRFCHAVGAVSGGTNSKNVGGLVGRSLLPSTAFGGRIGDCYFLAPASGGGPDNGAGIPLTAEQMKQRASFPNWDLDGVWQICEGKSYPRLRWEKITCDEP